MIPRVSKRISSFFILQGIIPSEDREVYEYSFEILISTLLGFIAIITISIITNTPVYTFLYLIGFIPLRLIAGGYHAKNHFRCFIILMTVYIVFIVLVKTIPPGSILIVNLLCVLTSVILVFKFSPSEDENKPISNEDRCKFKKKSRFAVIGYAILICMLMIIISDTKVSFSIVLGNMTVALSLLTNYVKAKFQSNKK